MLEEKILNDFQQAMKGRDNLKSSVLSFLRAKLLNVAVAKKKKQLDDNEVIPVIKKQIKQHEDSVEQFKKGDRLDLVEKESSELEVLKSYLPPQISLEEAKKIIEEVIVATQASGPQDMGKVMKEIMSKVANQIDTKLVSDLVKERLSER